MVGRRGEGGRNKGGREREGGIKGEEEGHGKDKRMKDMRRSTRKRETE